MPSYCHSLTAPETAEFSYVATMTKCSPPSLGCVFKIWMKLSIGSMASQHNSMTAVHQWLGTACLSCSVCSQWHCHQASHYHSHLLFSWSHLPTDSSQFTLYYSLWFSNLFHWRLWWRLFGDILDILFFCGLYLYHRRILISGCGCFRPDFAFPLAFVLTRPMFVDANGLELSFIRRAVFTARTCEQAAWGIKQEHFSNGYISTVKTLPVHKNKTPKLGNKDDSFRVLDFCCFGSVW